MTKILEAHKLQALNGQKHPLTPKVDLDLYQGEVIFLRGENGAGKSTLLKTLLGLHSSYQGNFKIHIPKRKIQYLPQLGSLHFHIPLSLEDMLPPEAFSSSLLKGLDLKKKWNTASGGERQKILLAGVLALEPQLLVLDEPFNHVDQESSKNIESALSDFVVSHPQSSLMLVSHRAFIKSLPAIRFLEIS